MLVGLLPHQFSLCTAFLCHQDGHNQARWDVMQDLTHLKGH
jgi:hypothetical protein